MATRANNPLDGNFRYVSERRQYGGLLIITGFCALIQPLANIATRVGPDGPIITDPGDVAFWQFVGSCCLFAIGVCSMLVGYLEFIHDWGEVTQTALLIVLTQTAFIPYISDISAVGLTMVKDPPQFFIVFPGDPAGLANQNKLDDANELLFMGACGILGVMAYGFAFVGAISFMQFALYAFRKGKPQDRNADYFRSRLGFYSLLLFVGGLCQLLLGALATQLDISNGGRIEGGLIVVAMFVVHFPYLSITVGFIQVLNGFWGFCRMCDVGLGGRRDNYFQYSIAFLWVVVLTIQDIVQIAMLPPGLSASAAVPTFAALSFGLVFMPAYLDHKMRHTPEYMDEDYYFGKEPHPSDDFRPMKRKVVTGRRKIYVVEKPAFLGEDAYDARPGPPQLSTPSVRPPSPPLPPPRSSSPLPTRPPPPQTASYYHEPARSPPPPPKPPAEDQRPPPPPRTPPRTTPPPPPPPKPAADTPPAYDDGGRLPSLESDSMSTSSSHDASPAPLPPPPPPPLPRQYPLV